MASHPTGFAAWWPPRLQKLVLYQWHPRLERLTNIHPHQPAGLSFWRHSHASVLCSPRQNVNRKRRKILDTWISPPSCPHPALCPL